MTPIRIAALATTAVLGLGLVACTTSAADAADAADPVRPSDREMLEAALGYPDPALIDRLEIAGGLLVLPGSRGVDGDTDVRPEGRRSLYLLCPEDRPRLSAQDRVILTEVDRPIETALAYADESGRTVPARDGFWAPPAVDVVGVACE